MTANCGLSNFASDKFSNIYMPTPVYLSATPPIYLQPELGLPPSLRIFGQDDENNDEDLKGESEEDTLESDPDLDLDLDPESDSDSDSFPPSSYLFYSSYVP